MGWHGLIGRIHVQRTRTYMLEVVVVVPLSPITHIRTPPRQRANGGRASGNCASQAVQNHAMQGTGHQMAIRFDSPVPATTKRSLWWLQCCAVEERKRKTSEAHTGLSDLQLLVVLAQLISTPRSARLIPHPTFPPQPFSCSHAPPQFICIAFSACQSSISTSRRHRQTGKAPPQTHLLTQATWRLLQRPINCSIGPPSLSPCFFVIFHQYDDPENQRAALS